MAENEGEGRERERRRASLKRQMEALKTRMRSLSVGSRNQLSQSTGVRFESDDSEGDMTDASVTSTSRRTSRKERRKNRSKMMELLQSHQDLLKALLQNPKAEENKTLVNSLSKSQISNALKEERHKYRYDYSHVRPNTMPTPPTLASTPTSAKEFADGTNSLKNVFRQQLTGEEAEGIHDYLNYCSRIASATKFDQDQTYDLLKSRIKEGTVLYRDLVNFARQKKSMKHVYVALGSTYTGHSSYISCLRKYNNFTGQGLSTSQFIGTLRSLAAELTLSAGDEDEDGIAVYKAVKEKTLSLLPSLAPTILDRYHRIKMPGSRGDLTVFTSALMTLSDSIEQALAKKVVKMITEQSDNHQAIRTLTLEKQPGGNSIQPQVQLVSSDHL